MEKLLTLLTLERQAQEAESPEQFYHVIVNYIGKLLPADHVLIWTQGQLGASLDKISGNATFDPKGMYGIAVLEEIRKIDRKNPQILTAHNAQTKTYLTCVPLYTKQDGYMGGIVFETMSPYKEDQIALLDEIVASLSPVMALHRLRQSRGIGNKVFGAIRLTSSGKKVASLVLLLALVCPIRQSVTAPMEIVAKQADYISADMDGLISKVTVEPGANVQEGQVLAVMDDTVLKADYDLAAQALEMARSAYSRLQRESLAIPEKKTDLSRLESEIAEKEIRLDYARTQLMRTQVKATRDGIAIYPSKNDLEGHPVRAGDVLMKIANPDEMEILINIPVDQMIPVSENDITRFYLNVSPMAGYRAKITSVGYEASSDISGDVSYKVKAEISGNETSKDFRVGWKGVAKIKTEWSILGLEIIKKPLLLARKITGI
ncbi:MAG: HlyD family efflux transporter periplasmic adaptor subunit [Pseudobdellovibrionaceae bacterium]|jgi:hypothetical protein|nr:HlyD family efflux transporter periplasmic adaptor subunit [Pseudobdellovibrionaceae bacterium]